MCITLRMYIQYSIRIQSEADNITVNTVCMYSCHVYLLTLDVAVMGPPVMSSEERGTGESVQVVDLEESSEDSFDMGTPLVPPSFLHQLPNYPPLNVFVSCSLVCMCTVCTCVFIRV